MPSDKVICPICKKEFNSLNFHIQKTHKLTMEYFRSQFPNQAIHADGVKADLKDAKRPGAERKNRVRTKGVPVVDPISDAICVLLDKYKILAFYGKMTLAEYRMRQEAFRDLRMQMGDPEVFSIGWDKMRHLLKTRDPNLTIPQELQKISYHGKSRTSGDT